MTSTTATSSFFSRTSRGDEEVVDEVVDTPGPRLQATCCRRRAGACRKSDRTNRPARDERLPPAARSAAPASGRRETRAEGHASAVRPRPNLERNERRGSVGMARMVEHGRRAASSRGDERHLFRARQPLERVLTLEGVRFRVETLRVHQRDRKARGRVTGAAPRVVHLLRSCGSTA